MTGDLRTLVLTGHVLGMVLWISGLTAIYWMLRFHDHAPKSSHEQLTLQERGLALATDIAATLTIGCGLAMAFSPTNKFIGEGPWLHVKLTAVVLLVLPVHGILRGRIKKYSQGNLKPAPTWLWSMLLAGVAIAVFCAETKLIMFRSTAKVTPPPPVTTGSATTGSATTGSAATPN